MEAKMRLSLSVTVVVCIGAAFFAQYAATQQANQKTAAEAFKNVQVLKRVPAEQWFDTMAFIAGSLGVTCDHCHSSEFETDDGNPAKLKAREMMRMVDEINRNHFDDKVVVTCNTCHRGSLKPQHGPKPDAGHWMKAAEKAPLPPSPEEILARYRKSIGAGTREVVSTQSVSLQVATYGGTGPATHSSFEFLLDGQDKFRVSTGDGQTVKTMIKNGKEAWINDGPGWRAMKSGEESNVFDAVAILIPDQVGTFESSGAVFEEKVDGHRAFVVPGGSKDEKKWLFFDARSGVLLRKRMFFPSFYGEGSVDIDYFDYQKFGRILLPTEFDFVNAGGSGLTISNVTKRRVNLKFEHSQFEQPKD
jgi:photosynthetic reaction center cytochrome c subunit